MVASVRYYGFLASLDGDERGPWTLNFECTDLRWFHDVIENRMPANYRLDDLRQRLGPRDYWTAWNSAIGTRNWLRHCYERYRNVAGSSDNPAPLALYDIELDKDRQFGSYLQPPGQPLYVEDLWYGLELEPCPALTDGAGMLTLADPQTDELGQPHPYRLVSLNHLDPTPQIPQFGQFYFPKTYRSQAVLQALHYARGL